MTPHHLETIETNHFTFLSERDSRFGTSQTSSIVGTNVDSSPPHSSPHLARFSTPLRKRRGDMTFLFDNDEDVNSSLVVRFPPEATQITEEEEEKEKDFIDRLPCDLGDPDFALHSSVYLTLTDPPGPPTYSEVEEELQSEEEEELSSQPVTGSKQQLIKERKIDLSASLSILWSQEQENRRKMNSFNSPTSSTSSNPFSRRAYLPVQVGKMSLHRIVSGEPRHYSVPRAALPYSPSKKRVI